MSIKNIFSRATASLGLGKIDTGTYKEDIDQMFKQAPFDTGEVCYICGSTAEFKMVAKIPKLDTAELDKSGFICSNCISTKPFSSKEYGLRQLTKTISTSESSTESN